MLHSKSPSMPRCCGMVRNLSVHPWNDPLEEAEDQPPPGTGWRRSPGRRPWAHNVLVQGAMRRTDLTRFDIEGVDWGRLTPMALECGQYYHFLTFLSLWHCKFSNVLQFHRFMTALPTLRDLELHSASFHSSRVSLHIPKAGHSLNSLHTQSDSAFMATLAKHFSLHPHLTHELKDLKWWCEDDNENAHEAWTAWTEAINSTYIVNLTVFMPHSWQSACMRLLQLLIKFQIARWA